jgi:hypothetical protein
MLHSVSWEVGDVTVVYSKNGLLLSAIVFETEAGLQTYSKLTRCFVYEEAARIRLLFGSSV